MTHKVEKRRREILKILDKEGQVFLNDMADLFDVSKETIRQDFDHLNLNYDLTRVHGGLRKEREMAYQEQYHYQYKQHLRIDEKKKLCHKAVEFLKEGDMIYVDGGSTVSYLLNYLDQRKGITLVTPSIALLMKYVVEGYERHFMASSNTFIFIGGNVNQSLMTTCGPIFDASIEPMHFDKMIFSCDAVDLRGGVTNTDDATFAIMQSVKKRARFKMLLSDQSKFGFVAHYRAFGLEELDYLITTKTFDEKWQAELEKMSINFYTV
ncbi:DeoR/GlpR family DNA-binding transcription regulator [Fusibacter sp. 3D3]|uniref:DeoR/GlpR family DNA-binding transcription regulator n=1 Tax=Fusibacter sp. 3D3 TaxID=1048380 RepID=UPI0008530A38|nr:DeoR/GlpR family DNA-binding transcription regulator [Fusibacter sp. 3D3]GAU79199.1 transcriptional repressor of the fructose operon [Fusibacter sp. 3D3]